MSNNTNSDADANDVAAVQSHESKSLARQGAVVGSVAGILFVWKIMQGVIDPAVTEHKAVFSAAVTLVCVFACVVFCGCVLIGACVGYWVKRK